MNRFNLRLFLLAIALLYSLTMLCLHLLPHDTMVATILAIVLFAPIGTINHFLLGGNVQVGSQMAAWLQMLCYALLIAINFKGKGIVMVLVFGTHFLLAFVWILLVMNM